jgi:2-methylisocitrate lyase-like PEP mutase family enzyme
MTPPLADRLSTFRALHERGRILVLPNAWDAVSARLVEACGASAIATTSAGVAWSHGFADGGYVPREALLATVNEVVGATGLPVSVDLENGYSDDPAQVAALVKAVADAGAVGINLEDGENPPELLAAKIKAIRDAGADLFINARTDVYLMHLVEPARAVDETIARAERYRAAGCHGIFVPAVVQLDEIQRIASAVDLPLNVLAFRGLAPVAELQKHGVRRLSVGSALALAALARARELAKRLLDEGELDDLFRATIPYAEINALFRPS